MQSDVIRGMMVKRVTIAKECNKLDNSSHLVIIADLGGLSNLMGEEEVEGRMTEHKKRYGSVDQGSLICGAVKRHKTDFSISTKEKKEKLGERITALQQLVSPFGKTDTASVLLETMEYINFLQDQVKVLSAPYLHSSPTGKTQESESYSLRSRGLCLVPIQCTLGIARSNGADIWAPIKASSPKY